MVKTVPESDLDLALRGYVVAMAIKTCDKLASIELAAKLEEVLEGNDMKTCVVAIETLAWSARQRFAQSLGPLTELLQLLEESKPQQ